MPEPIVLLPGGTRVPAGSPLLRADDRGVLHGDGVFETLHLRPDGPWLLAAHLDRMARSAVLLDLPLPARDTLATLAGDAARLWAAGHPGVEGALRLVCTRGPVDGAGVLYATVSAVPRETLRGRRSGVRVVTADLGVPLGGRPPWSLSAAKSLSYAANLAARRWATSQGADEVVWTTTEGYVLEAPTASVVWSAGGLLCTVPAEGTGILPGTTAAAALAAAGVLGLRAAERLATRAQLAAADGVWLASSLRGLAEVTTLDGQRRPGSRWTAPLLRALGFPG